MLEGAEFDTGEFIAITATGDEIVRVNNSLIDEVSGLKASIRSLVQRTHWIYHTNKEEDYNRDLWMACSWSTCRIAQEALKVGIYEHKHGLRQTHSLRGSH